MSEKPSINDPALIHLDEELDFQNHAVRLVNSSRRTISLLSHSLDPFVYNQEDFCQAVLDLVRRDKNCKARILVKNIQPVIEQGHRLLALARRLSSKVEIRRLLLDPKNNERAYLIGDNNRVLYKHDDHAYRGWVNTDAAPECKTMLEEFDYLWDKHSEVDVNLRTLIL